MINLHSSLWQIFSLLTFVDSSEYLFLYSSYRYILIHLMALIYCKNIVFNLRGAHNPPLVWFNLLKLSVPGLVSDRSKGF